MHFVILGPLPKLRKNSTEALIKDWNVLVTTPPGEEWDLLPALRRLGEFTRSEFTGILLGRVEDSHQFLLTVQLANEAGAAWRSHLLRVLPLERMFSFTPRTLEEHLREAVTPFVQRMTSGTLSCASRTAGTQREDHKPRGGTAPG